MNRRSPLVSVIIPTFNRTNYLKRAIQSVNSQDYDNIELIVVDDHSEESKKDIFQTVSKDSLSDVEFVRHDKNRGQATARNTGIEIAAGEYLAFLDDDDQWVDTKISEQVAAMQEAESNVGVIYADTDQGWFEDELPRFGGNDQHKLTKQLMCKNVIGTPSRVLVRSECIDSSGGFDERFLNWEDQDWYIRLSQDWNFKRLPRSLVNYNRDSEDRATEDFDTVSQDVYPLFIEKYTPIASRYGPLFKRKVLAWAAYRVGKVGLYTKNYNQGMDFLKKAILTYPFQGRFYVFPLYKFIVRELKN